jgi:hypothetical protein
VIYSIRRSTRESEEEPPSPQGIFRSEEMPPAKNLLFEKGAKSTLTERIRGEK